MKKIIGRLFVTIVVLAVICGGGLLIKVGINTFNKENSIVVNNKDKSLESLEKDLENIKQEIKEKINELNILKDEKQVECDKLNIEKTNQFHNNYNSEAYYESSRNLDKCESEIEKIESGIFALEHDGSVFTTIEEIKEILDNKKSIEEEIHKKEFSSFTFPKINKNKIIGVIEIIVGSIIILVQISKIINIYNKIVRAFHKVENNFANIDVYLKKRWELIPNIVESVKGYATHENNVFKEITKLRNTNYSNMNLNEKVSLNNEVNTVINKIMLLKEDYPELKANDNFRDLSKELTIIEDDIAVCRINYNDSVMRYNNLINIFPNNLLVLFFNYDDIEMFKIDEDEKEIVKVEL